MNTKYKAIAVAIAAAALGATANAGEVETFCKLTQAQTAVQSTLLRSPEAFTNLGDPVNGNETVVSGVRKSLSRHLQGGLMNELAEAQCRAYTLKVQVKAQLAQAEQKADYAAAKALNEGTRKALELAEQNVRKEETLLAAQMGRLADLQAAFNQAEAIRGQLVAGLQVESRLAQEISHTTVSLKDLAHELIEAEATVAELMSKVSGQSAWDISVSAGVRNKVGSGEAKRSESFVTLNATYNFGKSASDAARAQVAHLTEELLMEQRDGNVQGLSRAVAAVEGLVAAENLTLTSLKLRTKLLDEAIERVKGVSTTEGDRALRALLVDSASTSALLSGATARHASLTQWLVINAK